MYSDTKITFGCTEGRVKKVANMRGPAVSYQTQKLRFYMTLLLQEWSSFGFIGSLLEIHTLKLYPRPTGLEQHFNKISG